MPDRPAFEPGRLARAKTRPIRKIGPRQYAVKGNEEPVYYVDLDSDQPCTCKDAEYHGTTPCLHVLAARLQERDPALFQAVVEDYLRRLGNGSLIVEEDA